MKRSRSRSTHVLLTTTLFTVWVSACTARDTGRPEDSGAKTAEVARQPIPSGIDPRMVEWREDGVVVASSDSLRKTPGYVVDSIFPPEEAIRRFRATIPGTAPRELSGGAASADQLLRIYWANLIAKDSASVQTLSVDKAEFAYLYLPDSPEIRSGMQPQIAWLLLDEASLRGLSRARLRAEQASTATVRGVTCAGDPVQSGVARVEGPCGVVLQRAEGRDTVWIANRLITRDGVVKLLGFANPL